MINQLYNLFIRKCLFCLDPERAHEVSLRSVRLFYRPWLVNLLRKRLPKKRIPCFGLMFPNGVGLAAGLDKNGDYIDALFGCGFGFIEVGAVTPLPQEGNPKPRLFRLEKHHAIINRMGFNNKGVDYLVENLKKRKVDGIVGVNLGKNKETLLENAVNDYLICYEKIYPYADFATINISSPNTPQLRELQTEKYLQNLLMKMKLKQSECKNRFHKYVPLLVKVSPDLSELDIEMMSSIFLKEKIDGLIATNTSMSRDAVADHVHAKEAGGLSGAVIFDLSLSVVNAFNKKLNNQIPIIGVGGIDSADKAKKMLEAGASLIQIYSGFIYQGPRLVDSILA